MKTLFTILLCFVTVSVFSMPIQTRIKSRLVGKVLDDTEIQVIVNEEIEKDIVRIPVVEIPVITIDMIELDTIKTILVGMDSTQIESLAILVYDVSAQARSLRAGIDSQINSAKFKKHIRNKNWTMCSNLLIKSGVSQDVTDTLIASIGKVPAKVTLPFLERTMNENAFVVITYQEDVHQGDIVIFDIIKSSNIIDGLRFVEKNKDKIGAVIIGWDSNGMNNYDNFNIPTYSNIMKSYSDFFSVCKGIKPDLPVGVVVSMSITWEKWLNACEFKWDFVALWNITKFTANFAKIKDTYFKNEEVMICGLNAADVDLGQRQDSDAYRNCIEKLKRLGYCGSIYIKTRGGE